MSSNNWEYPENYEEKKKKITTMAIIGHTTDTSCKLWIRVFRSATWWLVVSEKPFTDDLDLYYLNNEHVDDYFTGKNFPISYKKSYKFSQDDDRTYTFNISGLKPNSRYYYALIADLEDANKIKRRTELGIERKWFKTLPNNPNKITFGFYSCHDPYSTNDHSEGAWSHFYQTLTDKEADFVIGGGDQIYVDTNKARHMQDVWEWLAKNKNHLIEKYSKNDKLMEKEIVSYFVTIYRIYYRVYWNFLNLQDVYQRFPQYMIWDDHEIMDGWGSFTKEERAALLNRMFQIDDTDRNRELVNLMFRAASQVYMEYQHCHNPTTVVNLNDLSNTSWDYDFKTGPFAFYALDMRGHHNCETPPDRLLGTEQHTRFTEWLNSPATCDAKVLFIVSPVPVLHWNEWLVNNLDIGGTKDDFMDEWGHNTNIVERAKLLDQLFERSHYGKQTVVFLSGDVHSGSVFKLYKTKSHPQARIYNITSSAISRKPAPGIMEGRIEDSGPVRGYEGVNCERLYGFADRNNFALITARFQDDELDLWVDLCWPDGDDMEIVQKKIYLS